MGGWGWDDEPLTANDLRLLDNARRLYDRIAAVTTTALANPAAVVVTPELIREFHAIATAGDPDPNKPPGKFRDRDNVIEARGAILFKPPTTPLVEPLVEEMCSEIARRWNVGSTVHAAAYALWRLNWIHPFADGNGKTARAVMYAILCIGFGRMLPGETALPDLIAREPRRYWRVLQSADKAWLGGETDVSDAESLVSDLIEQVLPGGETES